ncbi:hypothetical protein RLOC_00011794 [Lonchura striata]|uniref:Uncharacterized protein n=1 Tax=Lonchura striata TaxID=40157 RepID=A0A218V670_9PASE|nr:hypothetical protein RLOC_00011794 [Lonchura striata domestica]
MESTDWEGPSSPAPGPAQDNLKSHTMCLGVLSKHFLSPVRLVL